MANRVTDEDVKKIISTTIDTTPFITPANLIVTDRLSGEGLGDPLLKEIERWLAAHLVAIRDPVYKTEKTGDASATVFAEGGKGLDATPYGQQVKVLDITGKMATLGQKAAKLEVIDFMESDE